MFCFTVFGYSWIINLVFLQIADSFGGFDNVAPAHAVPKVEKTIVPQIANAPKWLKRPCGASFAVSEYCCNMWKENCEYRQYET